MFYDLETTGIDPEKCGIHQISGAFVVNGVIAESFNYHVKPKEGCLCSEKAMEMAGHTYEEMMAVHDGNTKWMTFINGTHKDNQGIPARSAIPLWEHIVKTADDYIANNQHGASLIFGHDQPLYRLITLIGLSLPGTGMDDILPMAANLQLIFMKNQNNEIYVSFIYNETQQFLPIESHPIAGIYRWDDVKSYVKIQSLTIIDHF